MHCILEFARKLKKNEIAEIETGTKVDELEWTAKDNRSTGTKTIRRDLFICASPARLDDENTKFRRWNKSSRGGGNSAARTVFE